GSRIPVCGGRGRVRRSVVFRAVEREFLVKASPTRAWEHLALVERWPTWARHIRRVVVSPPGPLGPESSGQIRLRNGVRSTFRMAAFDPPVSWMWVGRFLWLHLSYDHPFPPPPPPPPPPPHPPPRT